MAATSSIQTVSRDLPELHYRQETQDSRRPPQITKHATQRHVTQLYTKDSDYLNTLQRTGDADLRF